MPGLFVTGTDTDVGKTFVSAIIARELSSDGVQVGAFKPACSGAETVNGSRRWSDLDVLADATGTADVDSICRQRFTAPLAPPVAARLEGRTVDESEIRDSFLKAREASEFLIVEGVGGLLCPLTESKTIADFAAWTEFPLIIVARLGLGTINHTLLTVEAATHRKLPIAGVILNDAENLAETPAGRTNSEELGSLLPVPLLGIVEFQGTSVCLRDESSPARMNWLELSGE